MQFRARLELHGKTATGIEVPQEVVSALGPGKRPAVRVTIGGYTYATSIGSMGGRSLLPVSADVREKAGVAAGDDLEVGVELDTAPREVGVPPALAEALAADPVAGRAFEALSNSGKKRLTLPVEQAKTDATRDRRVAAALDQLRGGAA